MSTTHHINLCGQSHGSEDDWKDLYEASFPQDERMSIKEVRSLLANGTMLLHKTTDGTGALQCFSLVTILSNNVLLAYIATDQTKRSSGVGSKHMKALIDLLKKLYPTYIGLFLEIESTKEKNLSTDEDKARKRRLAFYQRLHCKRMLGKEYLLPSYTPGTPARQGELLWSEFGGAVDSDATLKAVIHEIYTKAYSLPTTDPSYVKVISQFTAATTPSSTTPAPATPAVTSGASTAPAVQPVDVADVHVNPTVTPSGTTGAAGGDGKISSAPSPVVSPAPAPEPTPVPATSTDSSPKS
jgi:hypothetical protein